MHLKDNLDNVASLFFQQRNVNLYNRFDGLYRAVVVETNDPLQLHRIRYKCPEMHDIDLKSEQCPWAVPAYSLGGKNAGSWESPMIGDIVFISFEKAHTYGPIWVGFAPGTRRRRYPLEQIYTESPLSVDKDGKPSKKPDDYLKEYLPKDKRPMSSGWRDRYGNSEVNSSVGFFPIEHDIKPAPAGVDGIVRSKFEAGEKPKMNEPDMKYLARTTKYGTFIIHSDFGYWWKKDPKDDPKYGEFKGIGDPLDDGGEEERKFEEDRYKYFVKLYNEDEPNSVSDGKQKADQRRFEIRTRAGHKFELRDVGWAQKDGGLSVSKKIQDVKSRKEEGEYGGQILSKYEDGDERWIKLRSKGGHLIQIMDAGFHPEKDNFYKRPLLEECGSEQDEKEGNWTTRDSRQIRMVTRYGIKFVLDDRGSHPIKAEEEESPRGNGWLLKTRRSWEPDGQDGTPRGFGFEAIDKDELNTTRWYSPKSKLIEMNDRKDYCMFCTDMSGEISREWKGLEENEFATSIGMSFNPEIDTYHLKLDKRNGYLRLKTAGGHDKEPVGPGGGMGRRAVPESEKREEDAEIGIKAQEASGEPQKDSPWPSGEPGLNQGLECRDGGPGYRGDGGDGPWTEVVDIDHRGMWWSRKYWLGIWRARDGNDQYICITDKNNEEKIIIRNGEGGDNGKIQMYCAGDIEIKAGRDINLQAERDISFKAGRNIIMESDEQVSMKSKISIDMDGNGGKWRLDSSATVQNVDSRAPDHVDGSGESNTIDANEIEEYKSGKREPEDRAKTDNEPFDAVDEKVITVEQ